MSESEKEEKDILKLLQWALDTLKDKLTFGMPEDVAVYRRESRVKGVLVDAIKEVQSLQEENQRLRNLAEMVADNTKMPHQHTDPQLRLYCLAERANECLSEIDKGKK